MTANQQGQDDPAAHAAGGAQRRGEGCGGPLGLGDPDDTSLRKVEMMNLVNKRMVMAVDALCDNIHKDFKECAGKHQVLGFYKCRPQLNASRECYRSWMDNERLKQMCLDDYLKERKDYRNTGITIYSSRKDREQKLKDRGIVLADLIKQENSGS